MEASRPAGAQIPTAAIHILRDSTSYVVTWGSPEGYAELMVRAQLKNDENPARPEDWQARMFEP